MENLLFPYIVEDIAGPSAFNIGQVSDWGVTLLHPESIWKTSRGKGIKVCVIDTGIDDTHPDLSANVKARFNPWGPLQVPKHPHGCHVAGCIGAIDNDFGVIGIAPEVDLLDAKGLNDRGDGDWVKIAKCVQWAVQNGAHVINMSLGGNNQPPTILHDAIIWASTKGTICVAASGNDISASKDGRSAKFTAYPAKYPEVIAVVATTEDGNLAYFSQSDEDIDAAAPGVGIFSTWLNHDYAKLTGTSQASPLIAGAIALLKGYYGEAIQNYKDAIFYLKQIEDKGKVLQLNHGAGISVPNFMNIKIEKSGEPVQAEAAGIFSLLEQTNPSSEEGWKEIEEYYNTSEGKERVDDEANSLSNYFDPSPDDL